MQDSRADSIWVDGTGRATAAAALERIRSTADCIDAVDRQGWINVRPRSDHIELWLNPLSAQPQTICTTVELLRSTAEDGRPLVVRVHERETRGSLVAESVEQLPDLIREAVGLTSRPAYPMMQDRLVGCLPTDINDDHVRDMWRFLVATQFRQSEELVERVVSTEGRAKVVSVQADCGTVQYLAHDRWTSALWKQPDGFAGRYLKDLPMPAALKRSVRHDLTDMQRERRIVVSFVRGLRRVMEDDAPMDSFFRVSIPLRRSAGTPGQPPGRTAVVLLAPYA